MSLSSKAEHNMVSFQRQEQMTENGHRLQPLIFMGWHSFFLAFASGCFLKPSLKGGIIIVMHSQS